MGRLFVLIAKRKKVLIMNDVMRSPLPGEKVEPRKELMDIHKAIEHLLLGNKVTRVEWGDIGWYGFINEKDGILMIHKPEGTNHQWIVSDGDLSTKDWISL